MIHNCGRFAFALPDTFEWVGSTYQVRYIDIEEVSWRGPGSLKDRAQALWSEQMNEIRALTPPAGKASPVLQTIMLDLSEGLHAGVLYHPAQFIPNQVTWKVLAAQEKGGLMVTYSRLNKDLDHLLELVKTVARAYRNPKIETKQGYHLRNGMLDLPYLWAEKTRFSMRDNSHRAVLTADMVAVDTVEKLTLSERVAKFSAAGVMSEVKLETLESGRCQVAGMLGEQVILRALEEKKSYLSFFFDFPGRPDSGDWPKTRIELTIREGDLAEWRSRWDAFLSSFKALDRT